MYRRMKNRRTERPRIRAEYENILRESDGLAKTTFVRGSDVKKFRRRIDTNDGCLVV